MRDRYFSEATFDFLNDLEANNDRAWFAENKTWYEEFVKAPALRLIEEFGPRLSKLSPRFTATPRSLFRIHRDVRFSKDKRPYKTSIGIHFRHEAAKNAYAPGFYLHVAPAEIFAGCGIWHPESGPLRQIREHMAENPTAWRRATGSKRFREAFELAGDSLKRPPKGFDPEHPLIEEMKRKDFIGVRPLERGFVTGADLPDDLAATFRPGVPLMRFLCEALGVPFD